MDLQAQVNRGVAALRPHPHRGDLIAAGAVPVTVAVVMLNVRMDATWGNGIHLVLTGLTCAVVLGMGLLAEREDEFPRAYQTVLLLAGLTLLGVTLLRLAQVLGADEPLESSSTITWTAAVFTAIAAVPAWERINSPICALVEVVAGGIALLAFVDWVFDPEGATTFRWILLLLIAVYAAAHLRWRGERPRHAVHMVNAAGLAGLALAATFGGGLVLAFAEGGDPGTWWEFVIVAVGFGLVAYAGVDREPGPGYLGFGLLLAFVVLAGLPGSDGASIVGWPLIFLLLGGAAVAAGLRPIRPLPPPPDAGAEPAPTEVLPAQPGRPGGSE
jgi:FtsH-binding integral membrane protein